MATAQQIAALHTVVAAAQAAERKWGVPASVTLAQWIFESSWGTSALATEAHNYFGIKARQGATPGTYREFISPEFVDGQREEVDSEFASYPDEAASFDAHARLLATAGRYGSAMLRTHNPAGFAAALQAAGYSTSPTYAADLCQAIRDYSLCQYDIPPDGGAKVQEAAA